MCPPLCGAGRRKGEWGLTAWDSAPASPSNGGRVSPALLLFGRVVGWWHPGGGAARVGGCGWKKGLGGVPGRGAAPCPGSWKRRVPVGRSALALPAPLSLPALQTGRGSSQCLPGCCAPRRVLGQGLPPRRDGCTRGLCLCLSLRSGCCRSCLYPLLLLLLCPLHRRPCLVTPILTPYTPCRALSPPPHWPGGTVPPCFLQQQ